MEKAKRKMVLFYHYRKEYPFYYKGFSYDDPKIKRVLDRGAFLPLPAYDALGRRILARYSRLAYHSHNKLNLIENTQLIPLVPCNWL